MKPTDQPPDLMAAFAASLRPVQRWHYISFCDASLPTGSQFLGAAYVRGETVEAAITRSHLLGINPGGEAKVWGPFPTSHLDEAGVSVEQRERLLSRAEVEG